jgi:outer membrane protein TolC
MMVVRSGTFQTLSFGLTLWVASGCAGAADWSAYVQSLNSVSSQERTARGELILNTIKDGVAKGPDLALAISRGDAADAGLKERQSAMSPQIYTNLELANKRVSGVDRIGPSATVGVKQLIYDFGATKAGIDAANERLEASGLNIGAQRLAAVYRGISAWHELYRLRELVKVKRMAVDQLLSLRVRIEERVNIGGSAPSELLKIDARLALTETELAKLLSAEGAAEAQWLETTGVTVPSELDVHPDSIQKLRNISADDLAVYLTKFPAQQERLKRLGALRLTLFAVRNGERPNVYLDVSTTRLLTANGSPDHAVALMLQYDLFNGGASQARVNRALSDVAQFEAEIALQARQFTTMGLQIIAEIRAGDMALRATRNSARVALETLQATTTQFQANRGTLFDVLRTAEDLDDAASALIETETRLSLNYYRMRYVASDL